MVLLVLAVLWAAILVPPMLRARAEFRPADSIGNFRHQLRVLQRTAPAAIAASSAGSGYVHRQPRPLGLESSRRARTLKRRRDALVTLLGAMGATLILGLFPPLRPLWILHALLDVAFIVYVALLIRSRNLAAEREMKLRFLPAARVGGARTSGMQSREPALLLRRSAT